MTKKIEPWRSSIISSKGNIAQRFNQWLELLRQALNRLIDAVFNGKFPLIIIEPTANFQFKFEDIANCSGTFNAELPDAADAEKEHTVTSTAGTITFTADATIQAPTTVTTGNSSTVYFARGQWWHK